MWRKMKNLKNVEIIPNLGTRVGLSAKFTWGLLSNAILGFITGQECRYIRTVEMHERVKVFRTLKLFHLENRWVSGIFSCCKM